MGIIVIVVDAMQVLREAEMDIFKEKIEIIDNYIYTSLMKNRNLKQNARSLKISVTTLGYCPNLSIDLEDENIFCSVSSILEYIDKIDELCTEEVVEEATEEKKEPSSDEIIEGLKAELDKAKNDVARAYADTENMKKRLQKDADATRKYRFQQPATEILPILDSMEMALKVQTEDEAIKNYVKGFEMIHKQLKGVLEKEGVQEIDVADKPFDHNTMQALMQEKKEGVESGMVIEVLQKGYMLKDRILRPALVKVSE